MSASEPVFALTEWRTPDPCAAAERRPSRASRASAVISKAGGHAGAKYLRLTLSVP